MRLPVLILVFFLYSCNSKIESLKIKGSDTEVNLAVLLAEEFHAQNQNVLISISGGGSGLGIASLLNGNTDIANSSRTMKADELLLFKNRNIDIDSFVFAKDAIAFIVSEHVAQDSMCVNQIGKILSGEQTHWIENNIPLGEISIYGRQSNSGTHDFVKDILKIEYSPFAKQMNGNAQIIEAIKQDKNGIGYVSAGYVNKVNIEGIRVLNIYKENEKAISPLDAEAIKNNTYFFQRPLLQYYCKKDVAKVQAFFDFERSANGIRQIITSGYYPAN